MTPEQLKEMRDRAARPRLTVPIVLDGDLAQRIDDLHAELEQLADAPAAIDTRLGTGGAPAARAVAIDEELQELYDRAEASTMWVVAEGMPGTDWRALVANHPPRKDDDGKVLAEDAPWAVDRMGMEEPLLRACLVGHRATEHSEEIQPFAPADPAEPESVAELDWLIGFGTVEQRDTLFMAAWRVSRTADAAPLPRTRLTTRSSVSA